MVGGRWSPELRDQAPASDVAIISTTFVPTMDMPAPVKRRCQVALEFVRLNYLEECDE